MHFSEGKTGCKRKPMRERTLGRAEGGEAPQRGFGDSYWGGEISKHRKGPIDKENPGEARVGFFNINGKTKIRTEDEVLP